jgi:starvation-inducible outer membrane lipoprotein
MRTLLSLATLSLLLSACTTPPPVSGTLATKAGQLKVYPDGRFEIVVLPRTGK